MKSVVVFLLLWLSISSTALAANVFVGPTSVQCSGSGSSWSACANWSNLIFVRGNTYYLMDGTYSGKVLTTAESGTSTITIKKATSTDFGGGTLPSGVSVSGQAVFSSGFTFESSYWVLDGAKGSWSFLPDDYGFKFSDGQTYNLFVSKMGVALTDLRFAHFAAKAPTTDQEKPFFRVYTQVNQVKNVTLSDSLLDGYQGAMHSSGQGSLTNDNWIFERNVCLNGYSRNAGSIQFHGEWINADGKSLINPTIRWNLFKGADGGMTGTINANNSTVSGAVVYGNVFDSVLVTNGIVTGSSSGKLVNSFIYNNTFLNAPGVAPWVNSGQSAATGNVARNNLIYGMSAYIGTGVTNDYNAYFGTTNTPTETNRQTGSGNPFASMTTYALSADTTAGDSSVPAQYRTDRFGVAGNTRGAVQFGSPGGGVAPNPPSGLKVQ